MVVNFRARRISWITSKLARILILIKKKSMIHQQIHQHFTWSKTTPLKSVRVFFSFCDHGSYFKLKDKRFFILGFSMRSKGRTQEVVACFCCVQNGAFKLIRLGAHWDSIVYHAVFRFWDGDKTFSIWCGFSYIWD